MDEGCGCVIGIIVGLAAVAAFVVYVVLPLTTLILLLGSFILLSIGVVGAVSGVVVALYNFYQVLIEAHKTVT